MTTERNGLEKGQQVRTPTGEVGTVHDFYHNDGKVFVAVKHEDDILNISMYEVSLVVAVDD